MRKRSFRPHATAVALVALFVALGGPGYAAATPGHSSGATVAKKKKKTPPPSDNAADTTLLNKLLATSTASDAAKDASTLVAYLAGNAVPNAIHATKADNATNATNAMHATSADNATNATNATNSTNATNATQLGGVGSSHYVTASSTPASSVAVAAINFVPKLPASVPFSHFEEHAIGSTSANCSGPRRAAPGYICVYEAFSNGTSWLNYADPFSTNAGSTIAPEGVDLYFNSSLAAGSVRGNWAYTAP
jgi:hypothetical protein